MQQGVVCWERTTCAQKRKQAQAPSESYLPAFADVFLILKHTASFVHNLGGGGDRL